jgi:hypothetical protein
MHLSTVHSSSYYSGPSSANSTSAGPCLNMSITSRIMRGCQTCVSTNGINATTSFALHSRNIDPREYQGIHTAGILGVIAAVIVGCLLVAAIIGWAVKSNRAAFEASGGRRGHVVRHGNGEKVPVPSNVYQGDAGLNAPPRSYGGGRNGVAFPGPRNGFAPRSGASNRSAPRSAPRSGGSKHSAANRTQAKGPYADASPFSAVPTFEARGAQGNNSRNMYNGGPAPSQRSQR